MRAARDHFNLLKRKLAPTSSADGLKQVRSMQETLNFLQYHAIFLHAFVYRQMDLISRCLGIGRRIARNQQAAIFTIMVKAEGFTFQSYRETKEHSALVMLPIN
jgi:hypothetical protein